MINCAESAKAAGAEIVKVASATAAPDARQMRWKGWNVFIQLVRCQHQKRPSQKGTEYWGELPPVARSD